MNTLLDIAVNDQGGAAVPTISPAGAWTYLPLQEEDGLVAYDFSGPPPINGSLIVDSGSPIILGTQMADGLGYEFPLVADNDDNYIMLPSRFVGSIHLSMTLKLKSAKFRHWLWSNKQGVASDGDVDWIILPTGGGNKLYFQVYQDGFKTAISTTNLAVGPEYRVSANILVSADANPSVMYTAVNNVIEAVTEIPGYVGQTGVSSFFAQQGGSNFSPHIDVQKCSLHPFSIADPSTVVASLGG